MPDLLTIEHGRVTLGGRTVPGHFSSIYVDGAVYFDTAKIDGLSGKKKVPMGFEDAFIRMEVVLETDDDGTCYDKLAVLNSMFQGIDADANPKVYTIVNQHLAARRVDQVVFEYLASRENNEEDVIFAELSFEEHTPPTVPPEIRASANASAGGSGAAPDDAARDPDPDAAITNDSLSPFDRGEMDGSTL